MSAYCLLLFIAIKENTEIQTDEDKSSADEVNSQFSSIDSANPNVPQDISQNTAMVLMHSYPQDAKLSCRHSYPNVLFSFSCEKLCDI